MLVVLSLSLLTSRTAEEDAEQVGLGGVGGRAAEPVRCTNSDAVRVGGDRVTRAAGLAGADCGHADQRKPR